MIVILYESFRHWSEGVLTDIPSIHIFPEQNEMTKEDYVIICGDFGGLWNKDEENKIRPSVIHLMRGQIYELCGKKIFTFGGASSHDISGGILELADPDYKKKKRKLDKGWKPYRINHLSWWKEELPSEAEMDEGRENLLKHDNTVDFIVSHCASSSTAALLGEGLYKPDMLTVYLEEIRQKVKFKKWFFGHYHDNRNVNAEEILLWEQIIRIA